MHGRRAAALLLLGLSARRVGRNSAAFVRTPHADSAHLQLKSRLGGVTDSADGDTDHSPQDVAAQQRKLSADTATDGHLGLPTESYVHMMRLEAHRHN